MQELVYFQKLTDEVDDVPRFLVEHFHAIARYNPRITAGDDDAKPAQVPLVGALSPRVPRLKELTYLHAPGKEEDLKTVTHWVMTDLSQQVNPLHSKQ